MPTFLIVISLFGTSKPATIKNEADEKSPGITIFLAVNSHKP